MIMRTTLPRLVLEMKSLFPKAKGLDLLSSCSWHDFAFGEKRVSLCEFVVIVHTSMENSILNLLEDYLKITWRFLLDAGLEVLYVQILVGKQFQQAVGGRGGGGGGGKLL